jgi:hypothetical protein
LLDKTHELPGSAGMPERQIKIAEAMMADFFMFGSSLHLLVNNLLKPQ